MANPEHLAILKKGVTIWNRWREKDFGEADLQGADLQGALLDHANFTITDLRSANLRDAHLQEADIREALLGDADLRGAHLKNAHLHRADLQRTNFQGASLVRADLHQANLSGALLKSAFLHDAYLANTKVIGTVFENAYLGSTVFSNLDLRSAIGLDAAVHCGPSSVGIETLYLSAGQIPEAFLRGTGVPENLILYAKSLVGKPIEFYSCFISYSSRNQEFADRLHLDLRSRGVRCWLASENLRIGDPFRQMIDESIRRHDKLLVVLSVDSVGSPWVQDEVEAALERERLEGRLVLFPIRIDTAVMNTDAAWAASIRRTRHIGDFTGWKSHDCYQLALQRLARDLNAAEHKKDGSLP